MSNDNSKPKTFRSNSCYNLLVESFSGPILDNAPVYESKDDVPDDCAEYSVIASEEVDEPYGILMSELFATVSGNCSAAGEITGRIVKGKVKVT